MSPHRCRVKLIGRRCSGHDLCVSLPREVPPELRCEPEQPQGYGAVSYTHLRAHETVLDLVCRLLLEKKKKRRSDKNVHEVTSRIEAALCVVELE